MNYLISFFRSKLDLSSEENRNATQPIPRFTSSQWTKLNGGLCFRRSPIKI